MIFKIALLIVMAVIVLVLAFKLLDGVVKLVVPVALLLLFAGLFLNVLSDRPILSAQGFAVWNVDEVLPSKSDIAQVVNTTISNVSDTIENLGREQVAGER